MANRSAQTTTRLLRLAPWAVAASLSLGATAQDSGQDNGEAEPPHPVGAEQVRSAATVIGLEFTDEEIELMLDDVRYRLVEYESLRKGSIDNHVAPAGTFSPWIPGVEPGKGQLGPDFGELPKVTRPADLEDVCFWSVRELAALLRQGDASSVELTSMYLDRLERLDAHLHCVITLTRERAMKFAAARDAELSEGVDRGLLHGIPWGVKDLMAVPGYRTTWGAKPFESQVIDRTAAVVQRLDDAGAVLIAKLSVGALAWGDVWFGEKTRSPWNTEAGSSGSSAGSASATAAGGVAFALGTETLGSIVSPSVACATSALRPTFGRVPRTDTMALSWTMDKVGPIARTVEDAAIVFAAIQGAEASDAYSRDGRVPVTGALQAETKLRIGVAAGAFRGGRGVDEIRAELESMGHELVDLKLPEYPVGAMLLTLSAEAATAFDELTRSGMDDQLVRQVRQAWPNTFRSARLIPAVEYLRAQRLRTQLMRDFDAAIERVDVLVHAPFGAGLLQVTNLTGHPTVVAPFVPKAGPRDDGSPRTVTFTGKLDQDEQLMALVIAWQRAFPDHVRSPETPWLTSGR